MPKMGFETMLTEIEKGYTWPGTQMQRFVIPEGDLKNYGLQRKRGAEAPHYSVWMLAVGESGGQLTYFYGHRLLEAARKAYAWKTGTTNNAQDAS